MNRAIVGAYLNVIRDYYPNTDKLRQEALIRGLRKIVEKSLDKKGS